MADRADDSAGTDISRLNGKISSRIKSWRSSRLKPINKNRNNNEIKIDHKYYLDVKTPYPPARLTVAGKVPDVALNEYVDNDSEDIKWYDGRMVIELKYLADQMYCSRCRSPLHLSDISNETRYGLGSVFSIPCRNYLCYHENRVSSGKRNNKGAFDINAKVAIGKHCMTMFYSLTTLLIINNTHLISLHVCYFGSISISVQIIQAYIYMYMYII